MPCISPNLIPNPYFGYKDIGLNFLHDCESQYIKVPCGYCPSCIAVKQMYMVQRVQMEAIKRHFFMATLTYNNENMPCLEVGDYSLRYADMHDVVLSIKRIRNNNLFTRPFSYVAVSEFGGLKGRPHFHILFGLEKHPDDTYNTCLTLQNILWHSLKDNWTKNIGSKRKPIYVPRFTYKAKYTHLGLRTNYDLHYVNPALTDNGETDAAYYVLKYMMKDSEKARSLQSALKLNYSKEDYQTIWEIVKPRAQYSKGFGLNATKKGGVLVPDEDIINYLHTCVENTPSGANYPYYFIPHTGQSFPLAPYYRKNGKIYGYLDALTIYYNSSQEYEEQNTKDFDRQLRQFEKRKALISQDDFNFDDLD